MELHELTAAEVAERMRSGVLSAKDYARALIARAESVDPRINALALFDPPAFLREAERADEEIRKAREFDRVIPPLVGIPIGIKDVFDTAGIPTRCGSRLFADRIPERDAVPVERLLRAGCLLHSKTVTAELAYLDPGPTRNPWDLEHTPGGSSQGSAAGVAAGLFPLALGTQTAGSTIRPASYCGAAALVASRGMVPLDGVLPLAPSFDQLGVFARGVEDLAIAFAALMGAPAAMEPLDRTPFLGIAREYFLGTAEDEMGRTAVHAARSLGAKRANIHVVHLPPGFDEAHRNHRTILAVEAARVHRERFAAHHSDFGKKAAELIEEGLAASEADYRAALAGRERFRAEVSRLLGEVDALILPATPSAAPHGIDSTGDARFNVPWTHLGLPQVALPAAIDAAGLPLGIQLVGGPGRDLHLLRIARFVEERLGWGRRIAPAGHSP